MQPSPIVAKKQLERLRAVCSNLPGTEERLSHGEPTFFVHSRVFAVFANNHHGDGHIAVWLPAPPGFQVGLTRESPEVFFKPPYVASTGWLGIELTKIDDEDLKYHVEIAWRMFATKRLQATLSPDRPPARLTLRGRPRGKSGA